MKMMQPEWYRVTDDVNFVAALRQFNSQLRGNDAAATVGGVTGNTDFHIIISQISLLKIVT